MNEKLQYASMLDIPISSCSITIKPKKKRLFFKKRHKSPEEVKNELLNKVNNDEETTEEKTLISDETKGDNEIEDVKKESELVQNETNLEENNDENETESVHIVKEKKKSKFKVSGTAIAFIIIGALIAVIFLTTAFYPNSGINAFIGTVFGNKTSTVAVDERSYTEFSPLIVFNGEKVESEDGIMNLSGKGSIYSVADGKVESVVLDEDGKYTLTVAHSSKFSTVLSGLDFAYAKQGESVYANIPVGYIKDNAYLKFMDGETVISDYQIVDNTVLWAV